MNTLSYPALALTGTALLIGGVLLNPFDVPLPALPPLSSKAFLPIAGIKEPEEVAPTATLTFVGDIMMARNVEAYINAYGEDYPFRKVSDLLTGNDLLIGNFEGTVRETEYIEGTNVMNFDTTPENVSILASQGFDLLSLSNNHTDDFGQETTEFTRQTILDAGITPFGDAFESEKFVTHKTVNGIPFAFVGYHAFNESTEGIVQAIQKEDAAGRFVIVFAHWGEEYIHDPSPSQTAAAHAFINAGADAIIGAHPHVIQTIETYKGVPIVYSLGNFLFDQDWSEQTKRGMTVRLRVEAHALTLIFVPVYLEKRQMEPATPEKAQEMLELLGVPTGVLTLPIDLPSIIQIPPSPPVSPDASLPNNSQ